jgi:hypothetical protein
MEVPLQYSFKQPLKSTGKTTGQGKYYHNMAVLCDIQFIGSLQNNSPQSSPGELQFPLYYILQ